MSRPRWGRRWWREGRRGLIALAAFAVIIVALLTIGGQALFAVSGQSPLEAAQENAGAEAPSGMPSASSPTLQMQASKPSALKVSSIEVDAPLLQLGQQEGKDLVELPKPATKPGWFEDSATPGEPGVATIVGYIERGADEPGVFARLANLEEDHEIQVSREDGRTAIFSVDKVEYYAEGEMPAEEVYAPTGLPELRIVTCGGTLDENDPRGNAVVYAHLTGSA